MRAKLVISANFFKDVHILIALLKEYDLEPKMNSLCNSIEAHINHKHDAMKRRDAFTKYMVSSPNSAERETLRKAYLDKACLHKDWRSDTEVPS